MINLLPDDYKSEVRAARTNVLLIRYISILTVAIMVLSGIIITAYAVLGTRQVATQSLLDASNAREAKYSSVRAEADELRSSLSNAKLILDQKVSYSKLIYEIAGSMPNDIVLNTLELDAESVGSSMTIDANAKTVDAASKLRDRLASNNAVFSDVKLLSLESGSSTGTDNEYPVKVSVSVVINKAIMQ